MADLNKENVQPNCTTTIKQHKKNKLKVPKKTNAGVPFKPKEDRLISLRLLRSKKTLNIKPGTKIMNL